MTTREVDRSSMTLIKISFSSFRCLDLLSADLRLAILAGGKSPFVLPSWNLAGYAFDRSAVWILQWEMVIAVVHVASLVSENRDEVPK